MRIAVAGATSAVGRSAVPALERSGHTLVLLPEDAAVMDVDRMVGALDGSDVLLNLAGQVPVSGVAGRRRAWRQHDLLRSEGVRGLLQAARAAGVRRLVHQSHSLLYADQGPAWITEQSPLGVTPATEPAAVGEAAVQDFDGCARVGVVLRMGLVVGDSGLTRWSLRMCARGRPIGMGSPEGYVHVIHSDDVAPAIEAALAAPSGTYNVGADPVQRAELVEAHAAMVGRRGGFLPAWRQRWCDGRVEPLGRSLRVSSEHFAATTGWHPRRSGFDPSWLEAGVPEGASS